MRRNRMALDEIAFRPRVLRNVAKVDASVERFGRKMRLPVFMAPVGALEIFDPEGSAASVTRAAGKFGAGHMLSSVSEPGLEKVAEAAPDALRMYQLYVRGDDAFVEDCVSRAIKHGYTAFCLTVDTAHYSRRERDIAKRYVRESRLRATGGDFQKGLEWRTVKLIKDKFKIPLVVKGIATAEDAKLCVDHGVDWIYVSNHGGRQLDHGRGSMQVLPEVVEAVKGRAKIMVDGSMCRGTDIVKAIIMGADLVGIGRLQCWALAAKQETGVLRMLELLEDEVIRCLGLLGVQEFCRARQILCASGRADQPAPRLQRLPAAGHRSLSLLTAIARDGRACPRSRRRRRAAVRSRPRGHRYRLRQGAGVLGRACRLHSLPICRRRFRRARRSSVTRPDTPAMPSSLRRCAPRSASELSDAQFLEGWNTIFAGEMPGINALLARAGKRLPLYAFSNTNRPHVAHFSKPYADVLGHFREIFLSSAIGLRKPDAAAYDHVIKAIGVPAQRIVFFDDLAENIEGARKRGLTAVHVTSPNDVADALTALGTLGLGILGALLWH